MFRVLVALTFAAGLLFQVPTADARNTPCSGKKGGVVRCSGGKFVCRDGSISASKQICSASDEDASPATGGGAGKVKKAKR